MILIETPMYTVFIMKSYKDIYSRSYLQYYLLMVCLVRLVCYVFIKCNTYKRGYLVKFMYCISILSETPIYAYFFTYFSTHSRSIYRAKATLVLSSVALAVCARGNGVAYLS